MCTIKHRVSQVHIRKVDMAISLKLIYFLLSFFIFKATKNSSALSIKLIHRHSVDSPFYPGNITRAERINLLTHSSSRLSKQTKNTTSIRPIMNSQHLMYMIQAGIGTFAPPHPRNYNYFLHLDTGSALTWTQCDECRKQGRASCFQQKPPLFPSARSASYRPLTCDKHPLCIPDECIGPTCSYDIEYADGAMTLGYLARETFTFASSGGDNKIERVKDMVFGCGIRNKGFAESAKDNLVAGNFGLGPGGFSFLRQKRLLTQGRFSYCLPPWDVAHKSYIFLRFGSDIPEKKDFKSTPLLKNSGFPFYLVDLTGISVGNTRLDIPREMLARRGRHSGGCSVDSGSSVTILPPAVHKKLRETLIKNHFSRYKPAEKLANFKLCYFFPARKGIKDLPDITFHLQDSDLVFPPRLGFLTGRALGKRYFCLAMDSIDIHGKTIIGAFQQADMRFVYDTVKQKLYFGPEDCTRDA